MTDGNLPALPPSFDDRAQRHADNFANSARSANTTSARRRDLLGAERATSPAWLPWCSEHGVDPLGHVRPAHLLAWIADLKAAGDSESTRNRRVSTVSAWYRYLLREEVVPANPAAMLTGSEKPKSAKQIYRTSPTSVPSEDEADAIQEAADEIGPYHAAVIALLANTGARASELTAANLDDLGYDDAHPVLSLPGKGGTVRTVPLSPPVWRRVQAMLDARTTDADRLPALAPGAKPRRPLLIRPTTGAPEDRHGIARVLARVCRKAGVKHLALTPHSMRGAYATMLLRNGVEIYEVQQSMGHLSTETTARYDHSHLDLDRHPAYRMAEILARAAQRRQERQGRRRSTAPSP